MRKIIVCMLSIMLCVSIAGCWKNKTEAADYSELVSRAILSDNEKKYLEGECSGEGHVIIDSSLSGNVLTVYALTTYGNYAFNNDMFIKTSGSGIIPAVLTFEKNGSEYTLKSIQYPEDGSGYLQSIKKMFPEKYWDTVLNPDDKTKEDITGQERNYAKTYLDSIGRDAAIGEYRDLNTVLLTDLGVSTDVSNKLICDERLAEYPYWVGSEEMLDNGKRIVREISFDANKNIIEFSTYDKEGKTVLERYVFDALTGEELK